MTFKKTKIFILSIMGKVEQVDGYTFEACFSNGVLFDVGVYRSGTRGKWAVTDIRTGMGITPAVYETRRKTVEAFQKTYCSKLERLVYSNEHYGNDPACYENRYERDARFFAELVDDYERGAA